MDALWPTPVRKAIKTGPDREIVAAYPYRSACPSPVWHRLISEEPRDLYFAGFTNYFLFTGQPDLQGTLQKKVAEGCRVRFLLGDPEADATRQREAVEQVALSVSTRIQITLDELKGLDGVEVRFSAPEDAPHHVGLSSFRFGDQALVSPHLARLVGHDSPLLHLRRMMDGGLFDRFMSSAEELWEHGTPPSSGE